MKLDLTLNAKWDWDGYSATRSLVVLGGCEIAYAAQEQNGDWSAWITPPDAKETQEPRSYRRGFNSCRDAKLYAEQAIQSYYRTLKAVHSLKSCQKEGEE